MKSPGSCWIAADLRWPDALQLGAAIVAREMFQGTEIIFVSASQHLLAAARTEGFNVLDPVNEAETVQA